MSALVNPSRAFVVAVWLLTAFFAIGVAASVYRVPLQVSETPGVILEALATSWPYAPGT